MTRSQTEESTLVAVYDILNCGPRSRFTANGKLVHNSNYNPQNMPRVGTTPKVSDALRNCLKAPKGHMVVVADLSGIELRVNHFLWKVKSTMKLYAGNAEADLYKVFAAARYGVPESEVTKPQRQLAKVAQLGLGFGAGWATFKKVAKTMGGIVLTDDESQAVVEAWRTQYSEITNGWRTCHARLQDIRDGVETPVDPWGLMVTCPEGIRGPSGRIIRYPALHTEPGTQGREEWWYGSGRHRARIYAGKIDENCIAEGTLVLTPDGWLRIECVQPTDLVHDGVSFVPHGGLVCKQVQPVIPIDGVYMTPDHEVLTNEGWKAALEGPRPFRPDIWGIDSLELGGFRRTPHAVALSVPVRSAGSKAGGGRDGGVETRGDPQLRVYDILNCGPLHRFVVRGTKGPFIVHNCVQFLARDVVADNALDVFKQTGFRPVLSVHDELVYIAPEGEAQALLDSVQSIMRTPPKWWPQLITWSEGDIARTYGAAK